MTRWGDLRVYYDAARSLAAGASPYATAPDAHPYVYSWIWLLPLVPVVRLPWRIFGAAAFALACALSFVAAYHALRVAGLARATRRADLRDDAFVLAALAVGGQLTCATALATLNAEALCVTSILVGLARPEHSRSRAWCLAAAAALKPHYLILAVLDAALPTRDGPRSLAALVTRVAPAGLLTWELNVVPFLARPEWAAELLAALSRQGLEVGHIQPAPTAILWDALGLHGPARVGAALVWLCACAGLAWRHARRSDTCGDPVSRALFLLCIFALATPRMKDYALLLLLVPVLASLPHRDRSMRGARAAILTGWLGWVAVAWGRGPDVLLSGLSYALYFGSLWFGWRVIARRTVRGAAPLEQCAAAIHRRCSSP